MTTCKTYCNRIVFFFGARNDNDLLCLTTNPFAAIIFATCSLNFSVSLPLKPPTFIMDSLWRFDHSVHSLANGTWPTNTELSIVWQSVSECVKSAFSSSRSTSVNFYLSSKELRFHASFSLFHFLCHSHDPPLPHYFPIYSILPINF